MMVAGTANNSPNPIAAAFLPRAQEPQDLVELGYVAGAYGVAGGLKVQPYSCHTDTLLVVDQWWLLPPEKNDKSGGQNFIPLSLLTSKKHSGMILAQAKGLTDRTVAQSFKGSTVWVSRSMFPGVADGEYYWIDLIGLQAFNPRGILLGKVIGLADNGAHPILRILPATQTNPVELVAAELLVPFVAAYVRDVDLPNQRICLDWELDY